MTVFDVIVVGAGPGGSALAIRLARDGHSVLLLEKNRFPRDKVCGDLVSARALRLLSDIGCADEILRRPLLPVTDCGVYLDGQLLIDGELPRLPEYPPSGRTVPRIELDEIIFRAAVAAGARVQEDCTVISHDVQPSGVEVHADVKGRRKRFRGRIIVGADGAGSIVARGAGLEMRDARYVQLAMRAYCHGLPRRSAILYFAEEFFPGYGWFFPIREGYANVGVGMVKESAQRDGIQLKRFFAHFEEFIRRKAVESGAEIEIERPSGWPIKTYGGAGPNHFERGLLVGDAGCFVDPISGEGIPLALQTAEFAAGTIRDAFARGDFGSATMAGFERRWRECYDPDLGISDLVVSAIRNRRLVKLWTHCLRVMALTAKGDRDYAAKLGGMLAGLVPGRAAFSADVLLKSLVHGPAFWLEAFNVSGGSIADLWRGTGALLAPDNRFLDSLPTEIGWFGNWAAEIGRKQLDVFQSLVSAGLRPPTVPHPSGSGTDTFLSTTDFDGSYDVRKLPMFFGGQSTCNGRVVFANLPVNVVESVLPRELKLAKRVTAHLSGLHPILLLYAYQVDTEWVFPWGPRATNVDYKELILLIPFVQRADDSGKWHNYVVRMYLDEDLPIVLGNRYFGYQKEKAAFNDPGMATPLRVLQDGRETFNWTFAPAGLPVAHAAAVADVENYRDALELMRMPILGAMADSSDVYSYAHWDWDMQSATVRHIDVAFNFVKPFRSTGMNAWVDMGTIASVSKGAFEMNGLKWRLAFPPRYRRL